MKVMAIGTLKPLSQEQRQRYLPEESYSDLIVRVESSSSDPTGPTLPSLRRQSKKVARRPPPCSAKALARSAMLP